MFTMLSAGRSSSAGWPIVFPTEVAVPLFRAFCEGLGLTNASGLALFGFDPDISRIEYNDFGAASRNPHPFDCAQGRLYENRVGWGTLSCGGAGEESGANLRADYQTT